MIFIIGIIAIVLGLICGVLTMGVWIHEWMMIFAPFFFILFFGGIGTAVLGLILLYTGPITIG